jgi:hypothetical protein
MTARVAAPGAGIFLAAALLAAGPARGAAPAAPESVAFELVRNQIVIPVRIEGQGPFGCLVDTGASPSAVDNALVGGLDLKIVGPAGRAEGVGRDRVEVTPTRMEVALGNSAGQRIDTLAMTLAALSRGVGRPIDCVLGQSWLGNRAVTIDYPRTRLVLGAPPPQPGQRCQEYPMRFWMADDLMPLVDLQVNGVTLPVSLDTGASSPLKLSPEGAARAGIDTSGEAGNVTGARGAAAIRRATAKTLVLGPLSAGSVAVTVGERNAGEGTVRMGNLGNGFLKAGVLTLDYPARRIRICAAPSG